MKPTSEHAALIEESDTTLASRAPDADAIARAPEQPRQCVLIVDDEAGVVAALRRLLRRETYELLTASSAEEGLRVLETRPIQLVISDERMPGMTGIQFLREIRKRWPHTVRMILSGYSEINTILIAVNEGAIYRFMTKPWNDEEIKISIRRALEQYTLEDQNRRMAREIAAQNAQLQQLNEQLEQRASDASAGLDIARRLLDFIDVGVLVIDASGLIVNANNPANALLNIEAGGLIGSSISQSLPAPLQAALEKMEAQSDAAGAGRLVHQERNLQWRAQRVQHGQRGLGIVLTVWNALA